MTTIHQPPRLKSSPWRARAARAPKAQAVAMGDLLGNQIYDMIPEVV